ncbi:MAG: 30S ribosomal protein S6 [Anaerolineae bacterium]|nr:30S ribosomal protein S6 [Anaerolineae bacterium]
MRVYELIFIVTPEVEGEELDGAVASVTRLVEREGGSVLRLDPWGLRRMAYPIQDRREGYYFLMYVELDPLAVTAFESAMVLVEPVLRYLMVLPQGEVKFAAAATEEPVEPVVATSDDVSVSVEGEAEAEVEVVAISDESTEQPEA